MAQLDVGLWRVLGYITFLELDKQPEKGDGSVTKTVKKKKMDGRTDGRTNR